MSNESSTFDDCNVWEITIRDSGGDGKQASFLVIAELLGDAWRAADDVMDARGIAWRIVSMELLGTAYKPHDDRAPGGSEQ